MHRAKLDFSKEELFGSKVGINGAGINLPINPEVNYQKEYGVDEMEMGSIFGSMNEAKYYDGVTADNVVPKKEDFIEVPFRLISATTVGAGTWKAADFSDEGILEGSMQRLEGKPLYKDHETDLDNWVGLVRSVKWEGSKKQQGLKVPAGINGLVAIDAKTNPKTARGVLMGSIFSNSVTVDFMYEMSHDFESEEEFMMNIGSMGSDGKMVRRIVKQINDYYESSLVFLGADPFAKAINDEGGLQNIDDTAVYSYVKQSFSKDIGEYSKETDEVKNRALKEKSFKINCSLDKNIIPLSMRGQKQKENKMKKFVKSFVDKFGKSLGIEDSTEVKEQDMIGFLGKLKFDSEEKSEDEKKFAKIKNLAKKTLSDEDSFEGMDSFMDSNQFVSKETLQDLKSKKENLQGEIEDLKETKERLTKEAKVGREYSKRKREEAKRLYKASVDEADDSVIALFDKANQDEVEGLLKQYTKGATDKFSGSCADCGSENFKFQSSFTSDEDEDDIDDDVVTSSAMREKYGKSSINIGRTKND